MSVRDCQGPIGDYRRLLRLTGGAQAPLGLWVGSLATLDLCGAAWSFIHATVKTRNCVYVYICTCVHRVVPIVPE